MFVEIGPYPTNDEPRVVKVEVHKYDTWDMDSTLALIILPMLKQFREKNDHSYPNEFAEPDWRVEDDGTKVNYGGNGGGFEEWSKVIDKMIIAFEILNLEDWPTYRKEDSEVVQEGTELFGKYFTSLWD